MQTLSIVTAVYNRAVTLPAALDSLAAQDFPTIEHVVQDGGSTDGTLALIQDRMPPGLLLESRPDGGIYDALNKGIGRASGDIIGVLHSDDSFADPQVLSRVMACFEDPRIEGVYGDLDYVRADGSILRHWQATPWVPGLERRGWMPPHPTLFLRRTVFEAHGLYDTSFQISADYEAILRWLGAGVRLHYLPGVLVKMQVGGESNRSVGRILRKSREDLRAIRRHNIGGVGTLLTKNVSKLGQFWVR